MPKLYRLDIAFLFTIIIKALQQTAINPLSVHYVLLSLFVAALNGTETVQVTPVRTLASSP